MSWTTSIVTEPSASSRTVPAPLFPTSSVLSVFSAFSAVQSAFRSHTHALLTNAERNIRHRINTFARSPSRRTAMLSIKTLQLPRPFVSRLPRHKAEGQPLPPP